MKGLVVVLNSLTMNIKWLLSYLPIVGKYFADQSNIKKQSQRDSKVLKLLHENKSTWNEGIISNLRQFSSKIYGNLFHSTLFKLFLTDESVPAFDPKEFKSYDVTPLDIRDHSTSLAPISKKYFIQRKDNLSSKASPVAVLTHGVKTTGANMGRLAKKLIDLDYKVVVGDLVGFGANKDQKLNELNLISDVKNSIKEASNLASGKPLALISHSMGTALQVNALAKIFEEEDKSGEFKVKVKDLLLISPWDKVSSLINDFHHDDDGWKKMKQAVSSQDGMTEFVDKNQERAEQVARTVFGPNWDTLDSLYKVLELNKNRPPEYRLQNINVIHGQKDPFVSFNRSRNLIELILLLHENGDQILPKSRFCLIRDGNHFDMQENQKESVFPIANIAQLLKQEPKGIESGEASFSKPDYSHKQLQPINTTNIPALVA